MGGSIRFPASMCGIVGLKPSRARTTLGPDFGEYWGPLTHEFVLTRSIRDTAAVLDAVAGAGTGDPYTAPPPLRPYREEVGAAPERLRDRVPDASAQRGAVAPGLRRRGRSDGARCSSRSATTSTRSTSPRSTCRSTTRSARSWASRSHATSRAGRPGSVTTSRPSSNPRNAFIANSVHVVTAAQYVDALDDMSTWSRALSAWWDDADVLVLPTSPEPPVRLGELAPDNVEGLGRMGALVGFTSPFDLTGQPAISLPLHWNAAGLPIGVQLVARYGREDVLLRLAAQLEAARPPVGRSGHLCAAARARSVL